MYVMIIVIVSGSTSLLVVAVCFLVAHLKCPIVDKSEAVFINNPASKSTVENQGQDIEWTMIFAEKKDEISVAGPCSV